MTTDHSTAPRNAITRAAEAIHSLGIVHWLVFLICLVNFIGFAKLVTPLLSSLWSMFSAGEISLLRVILLFLRPALLLVAATLLLFRRRFATYLFGTSALLMLTKIPADGMLFWSATVLALVGMTAFCMREKSVGNLA